MNIFEPILAILFALSGSLFFGESLIPEHCSQGEPGKIRIGFLIENSSDKAAVNGASLAVKEANERINAAQPAFEIVVRSMEGLWGTGSKQTVNLIFDEKVTAIAGSFLGRNAHLAEQVCAKSKIPLISARATDQTLTQAFVPWYFSVVPSDDSQAESLFKELYINSTEFPLIICDNSYDAGQALKSFIRIIKSKGMDIPLIIEVEQADPDLSGAGKAIKGSKKPVLLFSTPPLSASLVMTIKNQNPSARIYATLAALDEDMQVTCKNPELEGIMVISPEYWRSDRGKDFSRRFRQAYGHDPGTKAAYAYDAVSLLVRAISLAGTESGAIQEALSSGSFDCVSGKVRFDEHGNRMGIPALVRVKNGSFAAY
jgi:branched-chain amino acid transport system substrate-binding protein